MRTKRIRLAIALVLAVGMTGSFLVSSPTIGAVPLGARIHGGAFKPIFRGTLPPLSEIAARRPGRPRGAGSDAAAELEIIRRHQEQLGEEGGGEPAVTAPIPSGKNLPVKNHGPDLKASWQGSNHFDSRYADGGNQFSGEPPDQGLCAGNGFVMETVNSVVQVYDEVGHRLLAGQPGAPGGGAVGISLNQAFGYPSEFVRPDGPFGPFLFDINCYYDAQTRRWFHLADDLEQDPTTGDFTGRSRLDLAVSTSANPLGRWKLYSWAGQNDGTQGTPNHTCDLGPCFPDYPQLGADANGIYITVNEYSFNGTDYNGVQLYALSKADLVDGAHAPTALLFENLKVPELYQKAFTLRGAQSRPGSFERAKGGTEYFISSTAGDGTETGNLTGGSDNVVVWALTNTSSLGGHAPDPVLTHTVVDTIPYALPPLALQKPGKTPLLRCINIGAACSGLDAPFQQEGPYPLDAGDTRMMSSFFSHGVLWGTLDTSLKGKGGSEFGPDNDFAPDPIRERAGVAYFAIRPMLAGGLRARVLQQGAFGVKNANLTFPSFAMGKGKDGVLGATLVGPTMYPSAVYVKIGLGMKPQAVRVAARGKGPDDGFTGTFFGDFRPRWGDYGFAVPGDGDSVWFAAEYIAQRCGFAEFFNDPDCGGTRSFFANWSTRVSRVKT
jgi:hypothetical protein